jgi:hypothetical protein
VVFSLGVVIPIDAGLGPQAMAMLTTVPQALMIGVAFSASARRCHRTFMSRRRDIAAEALMRIASGWWRGRGRSLPSLQWLMALDSTAYCGASVSWWFEERHSTGLTATLEEGVIRRALRNAAGASSAAERLTGPGTVMTAVPDMARYRVPPSDRR